MQNTYCDAEENPLDLRIHPKQQTKLVRVSAEKDLGVTITCTLSWHSHIHTITAKANKLPGFLKQTCSLLIGVSTRRTLYLSLVKSTLLRYSSLVAFSGFSEGTSRASAVRRATRWILQTRIGEMSNRNRLIALDLLSLTYDRELKDSLFFYKSLFNGSYKRGLARCSIEIDLLPWTYSLLSTTEN